MKLTNNILIILSVFAMVSYVLVTIYLVREYPVNLVIEDYEVTETGYIVGKWENITWGVVRSYYVELDTTEGTVIIQINKGSYNNAEIGKTETVTVVSRHGGVYGASEVATINAWTLLVRLLVQPTSIVSLLFFPTIATLSATIGQLREDETTKVKC